MKRREMVLKFFGVTRTSELKPKLEAWLVKECGEDWRDDVTPSHWADRVLSHALPEDVYGETLTDEADELAEWMAGLFGLDAEGNELR